MPTPTLNAREIALYAARIAWEKDGQELRVLEFPAGGTLYDYCVLVNGRSDRQVKAIVDELWHFAKRLGLPRLPVEGESGWMVIDLLDVVVHAFGPEQRVHYALDTLWPLAKTLDHEAEFKRLPKLDYVRRHSAPATFKALGRFFTRIKDGLAKTRSVVGGALARLIGAGRNIDQAFLAQLEDTLLSADIGVTKTGEIIDELKRRYQDGELAKGEELIDLLKRSLRAELQAPEGDELRWAAAGPTVVLVVGVNGAGKTTTIAKLAKRFKEQGKKVLIAAGDTYRAAAIEQLSIWAERAGVDIVETHDGGDAAAVAFDAVAAAMARGMDLVLIDTAGRLHNKEHLMRELEKIRRVIQKRLPEAPHETLLVLDATAGQNAIQQAKVFGAAMGVTGLVLTKLDGTAKGGVTITIRRELKLPVRFIGVGEGIDDLQPFDPDAFIAAIFGDEASAG